MDDVYIHCFYALYLCLCIDTCFTANNSCKPVLKIFDCVPACSAAGVLHGHTFSRGAITYFKGGHSRGTMGLGNKWMCFCNKYSFSHDSKYRNRIYVGNVAGSSRLLSTVNCADQVAKVDSEF